MVGTSRHYLKTVYQERATMSRDHAPVIYSHHPALRTSPCAPPPARDKLAVTPALATADAGLEPQRAGIAGLREDT